MYLCTKNYQWKGMLVGGKHAGRTLRLLESLNIQVRTERLYEQLHSIETDFNHHQQLQTHAPFDAILKQEKDLDNEKNEAGAFLAASSIRKYTCFRLRSVVCLITRARECGLQEEAAACGRGGPVSGIYMRVLY